MRKIFLTVVGALLFAPLSFGIGKSGNGSSIVSRKEGFRAMAPIVYNSSERIDEEALRISAPLSLGSGFGLGQFGNTDYLELRPFSREYPELKDLERKEIASKLSADGWQSVRLKDSCITALTARSGSADMAIATWGNGKGVVIVGPRSQMSSEAIRELLLTLQLDPGACGWK